MATFPKRDELPSTRPYLIRAWHQWCEDHGFTPYVSVAVDETVMVPQQFVSPDLEIVLNIGHAATQGLKLGNEALEFQARFGGIPQNLYVPVGRVVAIYARENGQGMAFPVEESPASPPPDSPSSTGETGAPATGRPALRRIK